MRGAHRALSAERASADVLKTQKPAGDGAACLPKGRYKRWQN